MLTRFKKVYVLLFVFMTLPATSYARLACSYKFPIGIKCRFEPRPKPTFEFRTSAPVPVKPFEVSFDSIEDIKANPDISDSDKAEAIKFFQNRPKKTKAP